MPTQNISFLEPIKNTFNQLASNPVHHSLGIGGAAVISGIAYSFIFKDMINHSQISDTKKKGFKALALCGMFATGVVVHLLAGKVASNVTLIAISIATLGAKTLLNKASKKDTNKGPAATPNSRSRTTSVDTHSNQKHSQRPETQSKKDPHVHLQTNKAATGSSAPKPTSSPDKDPPERKIEESKVNPRTLKVDIDDKTLSKAKAVARSIITIKMRAKQERAQIGAMTISGLTSPEDILIECEKGNVKFLNTLTDGLAQETPDNQDVLLEKLATKILTYEGTLEECDEEETPEMIEAFKEKAKTNLAKQILCHLDIEIAEKLREKITDQTANFFDAERIAKAIKDAQLGMDVLDPNLGMLSLLGQTEVQNILFADPEIDNKGLKDRIYFITNVREFVLPEAEENEVAEFLKASRKISKLALSKPMFSKALNALTEIHGENLEDIEGAENLVCEEDFKTVKNASVSDEFREAFLQKYGKAKK